MLVKSQAIDLKCEVWLLGKLILIILYRCLHSLSRSVQQLRTSFQDHAVWKPLMKVRKSQQLAESLRELSTGSGSTSDARVEHLAVYPVSDADSEQLQT